MCIRDRLSTVSEKDSTEGNDVYLTIDSKLQKATYKLLEKKIASILISEIVNYDAVSYTHLDVYKRQDLEVRHYQVLLLFVRLNL